MIALGFLIIILTGTFLLMLPISSKDGICTEFLGALFTATSATCVTGLVVFDTFSHWTIFGQAVIITMIQIGGLGFITFGVYGMSLLGKRIGLKDRELVHESLNSMHIGGTVALVKNVIKGTFFIEGIGAILLSFRFVPEMGFLKGLYYSIFHSVSAFCNAGFDLMGYKEPYSSLCSYSGDIIVNVTIMSLIVIGGLGFIVWDDVCTNKFHFKKYMLHTKIVITFTAILLVGGTVFFYFSESSLMADMNFKERLLSSAFASVTPRTAGFNTIDIASMSDSGKLMNIILMIIGGSPDSTAGGIKTTTFAAIIFFIFSYVKKEKGYHAFKRGLEDDIIKKASTVFFINLSMGVVSVIIISLTQTLPIIDIALEVFSAIGTVGMSAGITGDLTTLSKLVIILLMYCGRIGSLSFALSFSERRKIPDIRYPKEKIIIG